MNGQISILRNPIIGNIFFRLKYIEKFGTGILRINQAYEHALKKPLFKIYANSIRVVLPVITATDLSPTEKIIVDLIRDRGRVKRSDIEKETQLSKDKIIRMLKNLTGKNIIARKGAGRGVWYEIP